MKGEKRPVAVQIFGSDIESMKYAAEYISQYADIIDINMGCPAPKVVKNGDGSRLLLDLELAEKIAKEVVKSAKVPVTIKMRIGWDNENIVAVEAAKIFEQAGISAITVHGRTRNEFYSGNADWNIIKKVKEDTNVDGIMIGRASLGNPWIFRDIINELSGSEKKEISKEEKLDIIIKHINYAVEEKGENVAVKEMRKHIAGYIKNMKDASKYRDIINKIDRKDELIACLTEYFKTI